MTQQETKAVEDAAKKLNWLETNAFIKGAQFISELRKACEPERGITITNVCESVEELVKQIENKLLQYTYEHHEQVDCGRHSENAKYIVLTDDIDVVAKEIAALMQPDKELLEALKKICKVAPSYIKRPDDELDNAICEAMLAVYNYEQNPTP